MSRSFLSEKATMITVTLNVNGKVVAATIEPRDTLLDTLRDKFDLTGAKKGCNEGVCGACTVLVDGRAVCSCNMFAVEAEGSEITTIEGLEHDPIQEAFVLNDALQCAYCSPGQILAAKSLLSSLHRDGKEERTIDDNEIKEGLAGNLCRCGCYNSIVKAVRSVARAWTK